MNQYFLSIMKGQRKGLLAQLVILLLMPFSFLYGIAVFLHRIFYVITGAYKAFKPVISIGNITVGGVGKTPLVIYLARLLQDKGLKPIILIRGYMSTFSDKSDEVDMLNEQIPLIPVLAGANRIANIIKSKGVLLVDLYLADDAFQHWPLRRDLNIVAIDSSNPFGNGYLLPAGILREPLSALKRADIFVLTKVNEMGPVGVLSKKLKMINPKALIIESRYQMSQPIDVFDQRPLSGYDLRNKSVVAFCAIGDPKAFEFNLKDLGVNLIHLFTFMDHYVYQAPDIQRIIGFCRQNNVDVLVTTHKDAVKLKHSEHLFAGIRVVYLPINLEITKGCDEFIQKVISVCGH